LIIDTEVLQANGTAERYAALIMQEKLPSAHAGKVAKKGSALGIFVKESKPGGNASRGAKP
jgi:hypothetical protein